MKRVAELLYCRKALLACSLFLLSLLHPLQAAVVTVNIGDNFFSPPVTNINQNDRVAWVWTGLNSHTTTHTGSPVLWDSGLRTPGSRFTNTFTTAGSFPYRCTVPTHIGQNGTVVVISTNLSPTVTVTFPTNNSTYAGPANIKITATAADADGSVTNVQFRRNSTVLANVTSPPYEVTDSNVAASTYGYSAIAFDNTGTTFTNRVVVFVVNPVSIVISNAQRTAETEFRFGYSGNNGLRYVVERSETLQQWQTLVTNIGPAAFTDRVANASQNIYRVGRLPNP